MFEHVTYGLALLQGLASFLSPCVLPLVPAYLSYLVGSSAADAAQSSAGYRRVLLRCLGFILGFSLVFILLGATATALGQFLTRWIDVIRKVSAVLIILMGILALQIIPIPSLYGDHRFSFPRIQGSFWMAILVGMAFGFGWTPCIGPTLMSVLLLAAQSATLARGILLLAAYSLGMALPFFAVAVLLRFTRRPLAWMQRHSLTIARVSGIVLILLGILMLTGTLTYLATL